MMDSYRLAQYDETRDAIISVISRALALLSILEQAQAREIRETMEI